MRLEGPFQRKTHFYPERLRAIENSCLKIKPRHTAGLRNIQCQQLITMKKFSLEVHVAMETIVNTDDSVTELEKMSQSVFIQFLHYNLYVV